MVAGFAPDDISITAEQNVVTIEGSRSEKQERDLLYRGISTRPLLLGALAAFFAGQAGAVVPTVSATGVTRNF